MIASQVAHSIRCRLLYCSVGVCNIDPRHDTTPLITHDIMSHVCAKFHLFGHKSACTRLMIDWVVVLGSSRQALSIKVSIESKYPSFVNDLS